MSAKRSPWASMRSSTSPALERQGAPPARGLHLVPASPGWTPWMGMLPAASRRTPSSCAVSSGSSRSAPCPPAGPSSCWTPPGADGASPSAGPGRGRTGWRARGCGACSTAGRAAGPSTPTSWPTARGRAVRARQRISSATAGAISVMAAGAPGSRSNTTMAGRLDVVGPGHRPCAAPGRPGWPPTPARPGRPAGSTRPARPGPPGPGPPHPSWPVRRAALSKNEARIHPVGEPAEGHAPVGHVGQHHRRHPGRSSR